MNNELLEKIKEIGANPDGFFPGGLSHPEMLETTGLTTERILTWYKRKLLPADLSDTPGRGNRRRYSLTDARFLAMIRAVADAGVPINAAPRLAKEFLGMLNRGTNSLMLALHDQGKFGPVLIVPGVYAGEFVMEYFPPTGSAADLWKLMRDKNWRSAIMFDFNEVYVDFYERLADVNGIRKSTSV